MPQAAVRDVGEPLQPEARERCLDGGEAAYAVGVVGGEPERADAADVLAGEVDRPQVEVVDQRAQAGGHRGAGVVVQVGAGVAEAGEVDGEDPVLGREQRDQLVERPPRLGEAVDEQDRGAVSAGADPVQVGAAQPGVVVGHRGDGGAEGGRGHGRSPS